LKLSFVGDANCNYGIIAGVRRSEFAIDFETPDFLRLRGLPDDQALQKAAEAGRVLVTHDHHTIPQHFAKFIENYDSPDVIIIVQSLPISKSIDGIVRVWHEYDDTDWQNRIAYLDQLFPYA